MIIECPACSTRYDIKVELPPEGRTVRCAKCEHVWRATAIEEELYSAAEVGEAGDGPDEDEADRIGGGDEPGEASAGWGDDEEIPAFSHGYRRAPEIQEDEEPADDVPSFLAREPAPAGQNLGAEESAPEEAAQEDTGGKVRWFGSFLRKSQKQAPSAQARFDAPQPARADPIPFPRPAPAPAAPPAADSQVRTLDDARAAVRNVFASLAEQRPHQSVSTTLHAPVTAYPDAGQDGGFPFRRPAETGEASASGWENESGGELGFTHEAGFTQEADFTQEDGFTQEAGFSHEAGFTHEPGFTHEQEMDAPASTGGWPRGGPEESGFSPAASQRWLQDWQQQEQEEPEAPAGGDLDAQLRAALQAHFPSHTGPAGPAQAPATGFPQDDPAAEDSESQISEALTAFWKRPMPPRSEPLTGAAAPLEEDGEPASADVSFDEHLFREIEDTQEHSGHPRFGPPRAGLALAAAWGLFLCVAGGLTAGLLGFRDMAADALPGLAPLYRALGMPVTLQPLIFEGVQYEWGVSDFKPVLHIKGAVYNRAQRGVRVPEFIVSIKDDDPALDKEIPAALPVEGDRILPDGRAEFDLELVSPSPSVTAVELELRDVR